MIAMAITAGMAAIVFNLFLQNQNVFRDQNLILEMQQSARAIASMMADELRMAGQGVPTYAGSMDTASNDESIQTFLNGTNASTIIFRAGISNGAAIVDETPPLTFVDSTSAMIDVDDVSVIASLVGANTDRFVFLWGETELSWTWVRAKIDAINTGADRITMTPSAISANGGTFPGLPNLYLEEALGYRISSGNIQRGESGDFTTQTAPVMTWTTIGENFTDLTFTYYDGDDNVIVVSSVDDRADIRRVDFTLAARTSAELPSTGNFGTFEITMTVFPRNVLLY